MYPCSQHGPARDSCVQGEVWRRLCEWAVGAQVYVLGYGQGGLERVGVMLQAGVGRWYEEA